MMQSYKMAVMAAAMMLAIVAMTQIGETNGMAPDNCTLDECDDATCRCSTTEIPGGMDPEEVPQFVVLSFDDGITPLNYPFYEELSTYTNPNGCNIRMSFFVCHLNSDYTLINKLYQMGHEIATHSVTLKSDLDNYWRNMTAQTWTDEMVDMRTMLNAYAMIPEEDVIGFRVPYLEVGGDLMYEMLAENGFKYDSSWPSLLYTPWYSENGENPRNTLWPYTLDYYSIQDETVGTRPTESFPGLWVNPMTDLQDNRGAPCPMLDQCVSEEDELDTSADAVADLLIRNFQAHYYVDRAPFGLYTRHSWFYSDIGNENSVHQDGFSQFLDYLSSLPNVYIVSVAQLLAWVQDPVPLSDIGDFEPLQCDSLPTASCPEENNENCDYSDNLPIDQDIIYMNICEGPCPEQYPWTGNPFGIQSKSKQEREEEEDEINELF